MSFFSWFSRPSTSSKKRPTAEPSRSWQGDATALLPDHKNLPASPPKAQDRTVPRKNGRTEQRELLYGVVREAMVSTGVLSSNYKFKVLSLDPQGHQFLVMMELAREYGGETIRWNEAEVLIAQTAKMRHGILVTAVYWRINHHVAVGTRTGAAALQNATLAAQPPPHDAATKPRVVADAAFFERPVPKAPAAAMASTAAQPNGAMPLSAGVAAPTRVTAPASVTPMPPSAFAPLPSATQRPVPQHEPIEADEVAAFKRALSQATASSSATAASVKPGVAVRSGPLRPPAPLTGFEDTEMPEGRTSPPDLGSTQYGELN